MSKPNDRGLFAELTARMADVNLGDLDEPTDEVQDDDEVVGVLTDELKRLYALRSQEIDRYGNLSVKNMRKTADLMESKPSPDEMRAALEGLAQEKLAHKIRYNIVDALFKAALRLEFPALADKKAALREGWQVAAHHDRSGELPLTLLVGLLSC
ncbi:MAG: hypothetical protein G01um101431_283 [Parcubacteria group bacterium Gr01-1014_31]|nr:MAG: hypothetical protein G01um101431_283 [Parcubacteria group bacterium Gr01-1014_31]